MSLSLPQAQSIALNRFGLGARLNEEPPANPKAWLLGQFDAFEVKPAPYAALPAPGTLARAYTNEVNELLAIGQVPAPSPTTGVPASMPFTAPAAGAAPATAMAGGAASVDSTPLPTDMAALLGPSKRKEVEQALSAEMRETYRQSVNARMAIALTTETPFVERLATFWSNHFVLSVEKPQVGVFAAAYEMDAIRPHVLGKFEDMLMAVEHHPAMLFYLDQYQSTGPDSPYAARLRERRPELRVGLNENLAREIMELHTLGVRTGYSQADVTEFARALTGWTLGGLGQMGKRDGIKPGEFMFRDQIHEPGDRTIMGKRYPAGGEEQGLAVLRDLAMSPATAKHISTKLARHFVADDPPPRLVVRMAKAFLDSQGDLPAVYRVMIEAPEAWAATATKFKTPWDWTVSSLRGLGRRDILKTDFASIFYQLGQPVWRAGSPAGYDDMSASWAAPEALMVRLELAQRFAAQAGPQIDARAIGPQLLPGTLTPATTTVLAQAESGPAALTLLLVSPEFQRR
ncbi:DUF1800 family protein [Sphingomonas sp. MMS24-J13]|uniref:DUF1800 domain-containing protein n=1 Tax=Sphingomonas sp. MMS24-J13 TaxID=3238686 RepID=UPI00384D17F8